MVYIYKHRSKKNEIHKVICRKLFDHVVDQNKETRKLYEQYVSEEGTTIGKHLDILVDIKLNSEEHNDPVVKRDYFFLGLY